MGTRTLGKILALSLVFDAIVSESGRAACPINVKDYGAKGRGDVLDGDSLAFRKAINDAVSTGCGTVYVPDGIYMFSGRAINCDWSAFEGIHIPSGVSIVLSPNAVIQAYNPVPTDKIYGYSLMRVSGESDVRISGGTLRGERYTHIGKGGEQGIGLDIRGSQNVIVENVTSTEHFGYGFYIGGCRKDGCASETPTSVSGNAICPDASVAPSTDIALRQCVADRNRAMGVLVNDCRRLTVDQCVFTRTYPDAAHDTTGANLPGAGLKLEPGAVKRRFFYASLAPIDTVMDVIVTACRADTNLLGLEIATDPAPAPADSFFRGALLRVTAENNIITASRCPDPADTVCDYDLARGAGIWVWGFASQCVITGNTVRTSGKYGIRLGDARDITLTGNTVWESGRDAHAAYADIYLEGATQGANVQRNTCRGATANPQPKHGIWIRAACLQNFVTNNDLLGSWSTSAFADSSLYTERTAAHWESAGVLPVAVGPLSPCEPGAVVSWAAPPFAYGPGVYAVERSADAGLTWERVMPETRATRYVDADAPAGTRYRVAARDWFGTEHASGEVALAPCALSLEAWPVPARGRTLAIAVHVPESEGADASLMVLDAGGRVVAELVRGARVSGRTVITWDRRTTRGARASPGLYWLRLALGGRTVQRKQVVLL
jgi:parallel beta-helix repeat protein